MKISSLYFFLLLRFSLPVFAQTLNVSTALKWLPHNKDTISINQYKESLQSFDKFIQSFDTLFHSIIKDSTTRYWSPIEQQKIKLLLEDLSGYNLKKALLSKEKGSFKNTFYDYIDSLENTRVEISKAYQHAHLSIFGETKDSSKTIGLLQGINYVAQTLNIVKNDPEKLKSSLEILKKINNDPILKEQIKLLKKKTNFYSQDHEELCKTILLLASYTEEKNTSFFANLMINYQEKYQEFINEYFISELRKSHNFRFVIQAYDQGKISHIDPVTSITNQLKSKFDNLHWLFSFYYPQEYKSLYKEDIDSALDTIFKSLSSIECLDCTFDSLSHKNDASTINQFRVLVRNGIGKDILSHVSFSLALDSLMDGFHLNNSQKASIDEFISKSKKEIQKLGLLKEVISYEDEYVNLSYNLSPTELKRDGDSISLSYVLNLNIGMDTAKSIGIYIVDVTVNKALYELLKSENKDEAIRKLLKERINLNTTSLKKWLLSQGIPEEYISVSNIEKLTNLEEGIPLELFGHCAKFFPIKPEIDSTDASKCFILETTTFMGSAQKAIEKYLAMLAKSLLEKHQDKINETINNILNTYSLSKDGEHILNILNVIYHKGTISFQVPLDPLHKVLSNSHLNVSISNDGALKEITPIISPSLLIDVALQKIPFLESCDQQMSTYSKDVCFTWGNNNIKVGRIIQKNNKQEFIPQKIALPLTIFSSAETMLISADLNNQDNSITLYCKGLSIPFLDIHFRRSFDIKFQQKNHTLEISSSEDLQLPLIDYINNYLHQSLALPEYINIVNTQLTDEGIQLVYDTIYVEGREKEVAVFLQNNLSLLSKNTIENFKENALNELKNLITSHLIQKYEDILKLLNDIIDRKIEATKDEIISALEDKQPLTFADGVELTFSFHDDVFTINFISDLLPSIDENNFFFQLSISYDGKKVTPIINQQTLKRWVSELLEYNIAYNIKTSWNEESNSLNLTIPLHHKDLMMDANINIGLDGHIDWNEQEVYTHIKNLIKAQLKEKQQAFLDSMTVMAESKIKTLFQNFPVKITMVETISTSTDEIPQGIIFSIESKDKVDYPFKVHNIKFFFEDLKIDFATTTIEAASIYHKIEQSLSCDYFEVFGFDYNPGSSMGELTFNIQIKGFAEEDNKIVFPVSIGLNDLHLKTELNLDFVEEYLNNTINSQYFPINFSLSNFDLNFTHLNLDDKFVTVFGKITYSEKYSITTSFKMIISIPDNKVNFKIESNLKQFLIDQIALLAAYDLNLVENEFFSVDIQPIPPDINNSSLPKKIEFKAKATLFGVEAQLPNLMLNKHGLKIGKYEEITFTSPKEYNFPVPCCFKLHRFSGTLKEEGVILSADLSPYPLNSENIIRIRGTYHFNFHKPLHWKNKTSMMFLNVIELGKSTTEINLGEGYYKAQFDFGETFSDIIYMDGQCTLSAKEMSLALDGELRLFDSDVASTDAYINLKDGSAHIAGKLQLANSFGIDGTFTTQSKFSKPSFTGSTSVSVSTLIKISQLDITINQDYSAYVNLELLNAADFGFTLDDYRLLNKDVLEEFLKDMAKNLFENIKDVDKAFEAMASGNFNINPTAKFGKDKGASGNGKALANIKSQNPAFETNNYVTDHPNLGLGINTITDITSNQGNTTYPNITSNSDNNINQDITSTENNTNPGVTSTSGTTSNISSLGIFGNIPCNSINESITIIDDQLVLQKEGLPKCILNKKYFNGTSLKADYKRTNVCDNGYTILDNNNSLFLFNNIGNSDPQLKETHLPLAHFDLSFAKLKELKSNKDNKYLTFERFYYHTLYHTGLGKHYDDNYDPTILNTDSYRGWVYKIKGDTNHYVFVYNFSSNKILFFSINNPGEPINKKMMDALIQSKLQ